MASHTLADAAGQKTPSEATFGGVYYGTGQAKNALIKLRIANGGAGESGLIGALATAFIDYSINVKHCAPFAVAWIKSDTTASFNHLADQTADVSITYHEKAEEIAIKQGIADKDLHVYAWRDHFYLVGPKNDPAGLKCEKTAQDKFSQLFIAATKPDSTIRFLSRFDKSATNIKESAIWASIGQTPWSFPFSSFYHICPQFPYEALETAAKFKEYTLTDRGTWLGAQSSVTKDMEVWLEGKDTDADPIMLNPARALVAQTSVNKDMAKDFARWLWMRDGGQKVVGGFKKNGETLYSQAPDTPAPPPKKLSSKL